MPELLDHLNAIGKEFSEISYALDERRIRLWCAVRANAYNRAYGRGGITVVQKATGVSRPRIYAGLQELTSPHKLERERVRRPGAGRKKNRRDTTGDF